MKRIMMVDDDVEYSSNICSILKEHDFEVTLHHSADGVIEAIRAAKPDLLIQDMMFPDNQAFGIDVIRQIRRLPDLRKLPVILLTGINDHLPVNFSDNTLDKKWLQIQIFMSKPADIDILLLNIKRLLS